MQQRLPMLTDNISNVEKFTTADGANSVTLGTKADDSGLATVTGGGGVDTINAAAFAGALTLLLDLVLM